MYSALRALRAIQAAGMEPNVVTYCGVISALSRERRQREQQLGYRLWCELHGSSLRLDAAAYRTGVTTLGLLAAWCYVGMITRSYRYELLKHGVV